jgi:UDP-N-acetylglucosamine--N-acetylmuramyl-(pentapeptide) pyrophosphoryl-undecaprenol N-acetylglucosamine transferase
VPYPFAAEDHQTVNAQHLVQKGAALMVKDSEAKEKVVSTIIALAADEQKQAELKKNISDMGVTDADRRIAEEILKTLPPSPEGEQGRAKKN